MIKITVCIVFEFIEPSFFFHSSFFKNKDFVAIFNCAHAVSNYYCCFAFHGIVQRFLNLLLRVFIQGWSCFIKQKNFWVSNYCSCNCNSLLLASWQLWSLKSALSQRISIMESNVMLILTSFVNCSSNNLKLPLLFLNLFALMKDFHFFIELIFSNQSDNISFIVFISLNKSLSRIIVYFLCLVKEFNAIWNRSCVLYFAV